MAIFVLKIGGGAGVDHAAVLTNLAARIAGGERWVLVHGCSAEADRIAAEAGYPARTITTQGGHTSRYTDARMIGYFCEAAANVNLALSAQLEAAGVRLRRFVQPGIIRATRHRAIRALVNGRPVVIRDDYTGTINDADADALRAALDVGETPVVAPVACGAEGEALNVDGDLVAATIARALDADALIILSNVPGLLRDVHDPASLVTHFSRADLPKHEGLAQGRMKKKMMAAAQAGSATVILADSRIAHPLDGALAGGGTHIGEPLDLRAIGVHGDMAVQSENEPPRRHERQDLASTVETPFLASANDTDAPLGVPTPGLRVHRAFAVQSDSFDTAALEDEYAAGVYLKRDITIVRGVGATLWDDAGNRYIDCVGGQGSANLGHCHPAIVAAIHAQSETLLTCPELFHNPVRAEYQAALCTAAGMARVFLCNSGTEANEAALKFARILTGRTGIVATMRGFHGRTMGSLSATWEKTYREPFAPLVPGFTHVPYNNIDKLAEAITDETAAVILEVVQGEGGVHPAQDGYVQAAQTLCRERGALLIIDEVQTGFGRTGYLFAHQHDSIQPDLLCVAKSMAGGVPMGAVLIAGHLPALTPAAHGSTFGGNPLACAAGLAALRTLTHLAAADAPLRVPTNTPRSDTPSDAQLGVLTGVSRGGDLVIRAREMGARALDFLRANAPSSAVREVRGRGLMIGVELRGKVAPVLRGLQARGVLALPAGASVLRLLPPLVIEEADLMGALEIVVNVLGEAN
jgi:acetylornithine/LysW-gamma-L-lysine aminotransferase